MVFHDCWIRVRGSNPIFGTPQSLLAWEPEKRTGPPLLPWIRIVSRTLRSFFIASENERRQAKSCKQMNALVEGLAAGNPKQPDRKANGGDHEKHCAPFSTSDLPVD
jgi:hypothetical protein